MPDKPPKLTVGLDFDGVIHAYTKGWHDGTAYDEPMPGAFETIKHFLRRYSVVIISTRDPHVIRDWLELWKAPFAFRVIPRWDDGPFWNEENVVGITQQKKACCIYFDDRAVRFTSWKDVKNYLT